MKAEPTWRPVRRFFKLLELDRKDITYIYVYAIFAGLITLSIPLGVQAIIGLIAGGALSASLIILVAVVTVGTGLTGLLTVMQLTVTETIQRRIFSRSAFDLAYRIPRLRLDNLNTYYAPELVNRFFDTLTLQKGIPKILVDFSTAILQIVFGLLLISFYHPLFFFFGAILIVILILIFRFTGPGGLSTSLQESSYKYKVAHWLEELARSVTTFKLAGGASLSLKRTDDLVCQYLDRRKQHFRILMFQYGNIVVFKTLITAGLLLLGSYLVIQNQINIGQFVAAEIVIILVMASVEKLILSMETIYDVLTALEKLGAVTDLPLESDKGAAFEEIDNGRGIELRAEDIAYTYPGNENTALSDLSLHLKVGEKVCLAGYNGAGKSTLIQIVAGLLTDFKGVVTYNNFPLHSLNLESLRRHIGDYCSQEDIFEGSFLDNITLGNPSISLERVIRVSEQLGLDAFVRRLPRGYETPLIPEGQNMPQHIRAKIILARSLASQPRLLALESIFHHLEPEDRLKVVESITDPEKPWTLLAVSNDPLIASHCERVLIMREGKIIADGSYSEIKNTRHFKRVFRSNPLKSLPKA